MAVYVDDMNLPATVQNGPRVSHTSEWSHLFADTDEELHAFAARLGLKRSYFQAGKPDWFPHYDVTKGKRYQALRLGATPVSARDTAEMSRQRRQRCGDIGCTEHPGDDPAAEEQGQTRRILVFGSQEWDDRDAIRERLASYYAPAPYAELVSGACPKGADAIAEELWAGWGGYVDRHPADWDHCAPECKPEHRRPRRDGSTWCPSAGHRRNAEMAATRLDAAVGFIRDASPGSSGMAKLAKRAGVPLDVHEVTTTAEAYLNATPPPLTAADRRRMADEYAYDAGHEWKAGDMAKAARLVNVAAELDPSRPELWAGRQQQIQDRAARMPLAAQTAARLAAAGVTPDDPAYQRLCEHNRLRGEAVAQAAREADASPEATT